MSDPAQDLTFLESFVRQKLDEGAKPYQSALDRARAQTNSAPKAGLCSKSRSKSFEVEVEAKPSLNFMPYEVLSTQIEIDMTFSVGWISCALCVKSLERLPRNHCPRQLQCQSKLMMQAKTVSWSFFQMVS